MGDEAEYLNDAGEYYAYRDFLERERLTGGKQSNSKMRSRKEMPFAISCRNCGSNHVEVRALGLHFLSLTCKRCGEGHSCGYYSTGE